MQDEDCDQKVAISSVWWTCAFAAVGVVVDEHVKLETKPSARFFLFVIYLTGAIIFYAYQANLISLLAMPNDSLPFITPEDLLKSDYE